MKKMLELLYKYRALLWGSLAILWGFRLRLSSWNGQLIDLKNPNSLFNWPLHKLVALMVIIALIISTKIMRKQIKEIEFKVFDKEKELNDVDPLNAKDNSTKNKKIINFVLVILLIIVTTLIWIYVK